MNAALPEVLVHLHTFVGPANKRMELNKEVNALCPRARPRETSALQAILTR